MMRALIAKLKVPASESQLSLALALSVLVMSGLLWAIALAVEYYRAAA